MFSKYYLHFRVDGAPLIFSDIHFWKENYGRLDYRVIQEKDEVAAYLTPKGLKQASEFGLKLKNEKLYSKILKKLKDFQTELKNKRLIGKLKKLKKNDLAARWNEIERTIDKFFYLYLYCEGPVLIPFEKIISKACPNKKDLEEILNKPKLAGKFNLNKGQKLALDKLSQLGEIKFDLHNNLDYVVEELYKFGREVARKYHFSLKQALSLKDKEMKKLLATGEITNIEVLNKRLGGSHTHTRREKKGMQNFNRRWLSEMEK